MKKHLFALLGLVLLGSQNLYATVSGDFEYFLSGKDAVITGYVGLSPDMVVPSKLDGHPVRYIGGKAFANFTGLQSVVISEGVTTIGVSAFSGCTNLTSVSFPSSLTLISMGAFTATGLQSVTIPSSIKVVGAMTFSGSKLRSVTLRAGTHTIGDGAFSYNPDLASITLPNSVTTIGNSAFSGATALSSIKFPDKLVRIGSEAFKDCTSLRALSFPKSLKYVNTDAFALCTGLQSAIFKGNAPATLMPFGRPIDLSRDFKVQYYMNSKGWTSGKWRGYKSGRVPAKAVWGSTYALSEDHGYKMLTFGNVVEGNSRTKTVFIKNVGGNVLTLDNFWIGETDRYDNSGHFSVVKSSEKTKKKTKKSKVSSPLTLKQGQSCTFKVTFKPSRDGHCWAMLKVDSNNPAGRMGLVVSGKGQ